MNLKEKKSRFGKALCAVTLTAAHALQGPGHGVALLHRQVKEERVAQAGTGMDPEDVTPRERSEKHKPCVVFPQGEHQPFGHQGIQRPVALFSRKFCGKPDF